MGLPKSKKGECGIFEGIKSKLGFADSDEKYCGKGHGSGDHNDRFADDYESEYDEYDDYGEYGFDYEKNENFTDNAPASNYDPYTPITTRPARSSLASLPKLVSLEDVRAHNQMPEKMRRDSLSPCNVAPASSYKSDRTMVESDTFVSSSTPNARAYAARHKERSESLNTLFSPTTSAPVDSKSSHDSVPVADHAFSGFTPEGKSGSRQAASMRTLNVFKPVSYGEAEGISKALRAGDVVVLVLRDTSENLAKRLLDFSFGVSSALDATVECVADKVFVMTRTTALSETEKAALHDQGVL